jgi:hypothetical protein
VTLAPSLRRTSALCSRSRAICRSCSARTFFISSNNTSVDLSPCASSRAIAASHKRTVSSIRCRSLSIKETAVGRALERSEVRASEGDVSEPTTVRSIVKTSYSGAMMSIP